MEVARRLRAIFSATSTRKHGIPATLLWFCRTACLKLIVSGRRLRQTEEPRTCSMGLFSPVLLALVNLLFNEPSFPRGNVPLLPALVLPGMSLETARRQSGGDMAWATRSSATEPKGV